MANPRLLSEPDDLHADANLKRIDDLEVFRKAFEGKEFDKKIAESIRDSNLVCDEIKKVTWRMIREKIVWIILGGLALIFIDLLNRAIPRLLSLLQPN